jgi:hypothetical protein
LLQPSRTVACSHRKFLPLQVLPLLLLVVIPEGDLLFL